MQFSTIFTSFLLLAASAVQALPATGQLGTTPNTLLTRALPPPTSCSKFTNGITSDTLNTIVRVFREKYGQNKVFNTGKENSFGACCTGYCLLLDIVASKDQYISAGEIDASAGRLCNVCLGRTTGTDFLVSTPKG